MRVSGARQNRGSDVLFGLRTMAIFVMAVLVTAIHSGPGPHQPNCASSERTAEILGVRVGKTCRARFDS
jgi:hypothetical protein